MFRVGQKVVCVDALFPKNTWRHRWFKFWQPYKSPSDGEVYTVANVYSEAGMLLLELIELPSPETNVWMAGFLACGFRPLVDRKTDISALKALLVPGSKIRELV